MLQIRTRLLIFHALSALILFSSTQNAVAEEENGYFYPGITSYPDERIMLSEIKKADGFRVVFRQSRMTTHSVRSIYQQIARAIRNQFGKEIDSFNVAIVTAPGKTKGPYMNKDLGASGEVVYDGASIYKFQLVPGPALLTPGVIARQTRVVIESKGILSRYRAWKKKTEEKFVSVSDRLKSKLPASVKVVFSPRGVLIPEWKEKGKELYLSAKVSTEITDYDIEDVCRVACEASSRLPSEFQVAILVSPDEQYHWMLENRGTLYETIGREFLASKYLPAVLDSMKQALSNRDRFKLPVVRRAIDGGNSSGLMIARLKSLKPSDTVTLHSLTASRLPVGGFNGWQQAGELKLSADAAASIGRSLAGAVHEQVFTPGFQFLPFLGLSVNEDGKDLVALISSLSHRMVILADDRIEFYQIDDGPIRAIVETLRSAKIPVFYVLSSPEESK